MRESILLVGHGSRFEPGNEEFRAFVRRFAERDGGRRVEGAFIELADPPLDEGIARAAEGADRVIVVPLVLFEAGHAKVDVPEAIDRARARFPGTAFLTARPIGVSAPVVAILLDRLAEAEGRLPRGDRASLAVLLVGRGTSDVEANGEMYKIARYLWERSGAGTVEVAFTGVTAPETPEGLRRCAALGHRRVAVLPYLVFRGVLLNQLDGIVSGFAKGRPDVAAVRGGHLGVDDRLVGVVLDRAGEARAEAG